MIFSYAMKNKAAKITVAVVAGLLSLSTTAFAGYKALNRESRPTPSARASMVPEIIEKIEEIEQVELSNDEAKVNSATVPTATNKPTNFSKSTPSARFADDSDDDVEFENEDKEDSNDDEKETHNSPKPTSTPITIN